MSEAIVDRHDTGASVALGGAVVAEYSATSAVPPVDTPKPYLHPLRTPGGVVVTGFAPSDHPWHHGLQFAFPRVGEHNLWGGGTYFGPDRGYVVVEDQGSIRHERWLDARDNQIAHELAWLGHGDEPLIREQRVWTFSGHADALVIDFETVLHNVTDADLPLETPAQRGRPDGGYGGLWLRLAEGFTAEHLIGEAGDISTSGVESQTLIVHGRTAGGDPVTLGLSFRNAPGNGKWLYRFEDFAAIGWAIAYDDGLVIPVGGALALSHRLAVVDGHIDPHTVRRLL